MGNYINQSWDYRVDLLAAAYGKFVCNYSCPYCHRDYFIQSIPAQIKPIPLFEGVKICNQVLPGQFSLHLAGSGEPLIIPHDILASIINPLNELENCISVSLTTNGYFLQEKVDELISLNINDINVSIPSLSSLRYRKIMNISNEQAKHYIEKTKTGIEAARSKGLIVDLNVCVSYDIVEDIEDFITLSKEYGVQIKLFPIISAHNNHQSANSSHFEKLLKQLFSIRSPRIDFSGRYMKIIWEDSSGAKLCFKPGDYENRPAECYECTYFSSCEESCWQSIRISPWYIQPCGIRTDNIYWFDDNNLQSLSDKLATGGKTNVTTDHKFSLCSKERVHSLKPIQKPFIVFEGVDGSGKSHISQIIAKELDFLIYKTPPDLYKNQTIMNLTENYQNLLSRYHYYISAMHYANIEVKALLNYSGIVCDRWIESTQIYHKILLGEAMPIIDASDWILSPDLIIVLDVDEATQEKRLLERGNGFDKIWETNYNLQKALREEYRNLTGGNVVHINNNGSVEQTINAVIEIVIKNAISK